MRAPHVRLRALSGELHRVGPGGLIGRAATAACHLEDPRVSEAHAMVSLRGRALRLMALRGVVELDGIEDDDFPLKTGQQLTLAPGVGLTVEAVELPDRVMALKFGGEPPRELRSPVYSLITRPTLEMVARFVDDAPARVWSTAEGWKLKIGDAPARQLRPSRFWTVDGVPVEALALPLSEAETTITAEGAGRYAPLRIVARYTSVHIHRARRVPAVIDGMPARMLSDLAVFGVPTRWEVAAGALWPEEADPQKLRRRWDRILQRLRGALREAELRDDLVRSDGQGNFELFLMPEDTVVDET